MCALQGPVVFAINSLEVTSPSAEGVELIELPRENFILLWAVVFPRSSMEGIMDI